jgi:chondroitin 4-sulfotransferase 11
MEPPADKKDRKRVQQRRNVLKHLLVNEEHKVIFCFIPKISCTNMKKIFLVMKGLYPSVEKVNGGTLRLQGQGVRLSNETVTEKQREYMLKNFYKFMIVRDPFERLVSGYRNKFQNKNKVKLWVPLAKWIIKKYRYNNTNSKTVVTGLDVSFTEYVRHLIDNRLGRSTSIGCDMKTYAGLVM